MGVRLIPQVSYPPPPAVLSPNEQACVRAERWVEIVAVLRMKGVAAAWGAALRRKEGRRETKGDDGDVEEGEEGEEGVCDEAALQGKVEVEAAAALDACGKVCAFVRRQYVEE